MGTGAIVLYSPITSVPKKRLFLQIGKNSRTTLLTTVDRHAILKLYRRAHVVHKTEPIAR